TARPPPPPIRAFRVFPPPPPPPPPRPGRPPPPPPFSLFRNSIPAPHTKGRLSGDVQRERPEAARCSMPQPQIGAHDDTPRPPLRRGDKPDAPRLDRSREVGRGRPRKAARMRMVIADDRLAPAAPPRGAQTALHMKKRRRIEFEKPPPLPGRRDIRHRDHPRDARTARPHDPRHDAAAFFR